MIWCQLDLIHFSNAVWMVGTMIDIIVLQHVRTYVPTYFYLKVRLVYGVYAYMDNRAQGIGLEAHSLPYCANVWSIGMAFN